jgi:hypothetical protein
VILGLTLTLPVSLSVFCFFPLARIVSFTLPGAELEPITLHECRHTFASLLIDSGANPKAIQTFHGHSKIQTTFDTYGHLMPGSHDEVRERMDAYLRGPAEDAIEAVEDAA